MRLRYDTLDVFTETRFGGNQLAVVYDADSLTEAQMQAVAREFNYSETVFLLKPATSDGTARMRIFTPGAELPFAGHPVVGTAAMLAMRDRGDGATKACDVRLETSVGLVCVGVTAGTGEDCRMARFKAPLLPSAAEPPPDTAAIAGTLGIGVDKIGFAAHVPRAFHAGVAFNFVPVTTREILSDCKVVQPAWEKTFSRCAAKNAFVYCRGGDGHGVDFHARMFAPDMGIAEDPATGSATAAFAGQILASDDLADGSHSVLIEQGRDMGRPSRLHLDMEIANGTAGSVHVGGGAVRVCEGWLAV